MSQLSIPTTMAFVGRSDSESPIVVDLDRTLIRTDLLVDSLFALLASRPHAAFAALTAIRNGKAALKSKLIEAAIVNILTHPLNQHVLAFLEAERAKGRLVYLASASDRSYVQRVADHLGEGVLGLDAGVDLAGPNKADRLCEVFGESGFDYIGDGSTDKAICQRARRVYIANTSTCSSGCSPNLGAQCASTRNASSFLVGLCPRSAATSVAQEHLGFCPGFGCAQV